MQNDAKNIHVMAKISLLGGISLLMAAVVVTVSLLSMKEAMLEERKLGVRSVVEQAINLIDHYYRLEKKGDLTEQEAQAQAKENIRHLKYGRNGYIVIESSNYYILMHGSSPELEGTNRKEEIDVAGIHVFRRLVDIAKSGGGYLLYHFNRPDDKNGTFPKLSYAASFSPWDWTVSSGLYLDDLEYAFQERLLDWGKVSVLPLFLFIVFTYFLGRAIAKPVSELGEAKTQAMAANKAKSDFLANMSHEVRTPINAVLGMSQFLQDTELTEDQSNWVQVIYQSGESLLALVNDIFDYTKIESGEMRLEHRNFNLCNAISDITDVLSIRAREKGIELIVSLADNLPRYVIGDIGRFKQILYNLVGNGIKFTEKGHVLIRMFDEKLESGRVFLHIEVEDTGVGIPEDKLSYIFQRFAQHDESSTRKFGGAGLGLAITQKLVSLMGGAIYVRSEVDKGSTFECRFSLEEGEIENEIELMPELDLSQTSVLVVDDYDMSRQIVMSGLKEKGFNCAGADSVSLANSLIEKMNANGEMFDFLVVDYKIGSDNGLSFCKEIAKSFKDKKPFIVIITAYGRFSSYERMADSGVDGFLVKPFYPNQLEAILKVLWNAKMTGAYLPVVTRHSITKLLRSDSPEDTTQLSIMFQNMHVLLVEDMPVNRMLMTKILDKKGCKVNVAINGAEAVRLSQQYRFDIVFLDCQMPVMDGYTASRHIREDGDSQNKATPIIALTANALMGDKEKCFDVGMNDYIGKPFRQDQVTEMLKKWQPSKVART